MSGDTAAVRAYRALTALYPQAFRAEYRDDLVQLFRDQWRDEPAARVCVRSVVDLAITIPTEHLEARMNRSSNPIVPVLFLALSVAGLALAALAGSEPVPLAVGLSVAAVGGVLAGLAWRRSSPVRGAGNPGSIAHAWWKFLVAGPALLVAVIVGAGAGLEAWYLGMFCVLTGLVLTAIGVVLGAIEVLGHRSGPTTA